LKIFVAKTKKKISLLIIITNYCNNFC